MAKSESSSQAESPSQLNFSSKDAWKRPFKNAKKLLWGEVGKSFFTITAMALTARTLGVADFGALTVLKTTLALIVQLITFESWQIIMRYGALAHQERNTNAYINVAGFALGLELVVATIGACFIAFFSGQIIDIFNIPEDVSDILPWSGIVLILGAISHISNGTLRLTDRFSVISTLNVAPKFITFLGALFLFYLEAGLTAFIYLWFITSLSTSMMQVSTALYFFKKDVKNLNEKAQGLTITPWKRGKFFAPQKEVWRYSFGLYVNSALGIGTQSIGGPILSAFLGTEAAGLYKIAEKISMSVASPVRQLLGPAIFTDLAWLNAQADKANIKKMILRISAITGGVAFALFGLLIPFGKPLIELIYSASYIDAYAPMLLLVLTTVLWSFSFTLPPLLLTSGEVRTMVYCRLIKAITMLALIVPLIQAYGTLGAATAIFFSSVFASVYLYRKVYLILR